MPPAALAVVLALSAPPERFLFETEADCRYVGGRPWVIARYDLLAPNTPVVIIGDAAFPMDGLADRFNAGLAAADRQRKLYVARNLTKTDPPPPADPPRIRFALTSPTPTLADPPDLAGWRAIGELIGLRVALDFQPGGRLAVSGQATAEGRWTQDGRGVVLTTAAATYRGVQVGPYLIGRRFPTDPAEAPSDWHLNLDPPGKLPANAEAFVGLWACHGSAGYFHFRRDGTVRYVGGDTRFNLNPPMRYWKYDGLGVYEVAYPKDIPAAAGLPAGSPAWLYWLAPRIRLSWNEEMPYWYTVGLLRFDTGVQLLVEGKVYGGWFSLRPDPQQSLPLLKRLTP